MTDQTAGHSAMENSNTQEGVTAAARAAMGRNTTDALVFGTLAATAAYAGVQLSLVTAPHVLVSVGQTALIGSLALTSALSAKRAFSFLSLRQSFARHGMTPDNLERETTIAPFYRKDWGL